MKFMFNFISGNLPRTFNNMFTINKNIHNYPTRQASKLHVPKANLEAFKNSIRYQGMKLWNMIYGRGSKQKFSLLFGDFLFNIRFSFITFY